VTYWYDDYWYYYAIRAIQLKYWPRDIVIWPIIIDYDIDSIYIFWWYLPLPLPWWPVGRKSLFNNVTSGLPYRCNNAWRVCFMSCRIAYRNNIFSPGARLRSRSLPLNVAPSVALCCYFFALIRTAGDICNTGYVPSFCLLLCDMYRVCYATKRNVSSHRVFAILASSVVLYCVASSLFVMTNRMSSLEEMKVWSNVSSNHQYKQWRRLLSREK